VTGVYNCDLIPGNEVLVPAPLRMNLDQHIWNRDDVHMGRHYGADTERKVDAIDPYIVSGQHGLLDAGALFGSEIGARTWLLGLSLLCLSLLILALLVLALLVLALLILLLILGLLVLPLLIPRLLVLPLRILRLARLVLRLILARSILLSLPLIALLGLTFTRSSLTALAPILVWLGLSLCLARLRPFRLPLALSLIALSLILFALALTSLLSLSLLTTVIPLSLALLALTAALIALALFALALLSVAAFLR
jgi:hypothetical protein